MIPYRLLVPVGALGFLGVLLVGPVTQGEPIPPSAPEVCAITNDKEFHDRLLKIAKYYSVYGRVDDDARWAPTDCRLPNPGRAYPSRSKDEATHGLKLYSLFVRDRGAYLKGVPEKGQVVVKEAWVPEAVAEKPKTEVFVPGVRLKESIAKMPADLAPSGWAGIEVEKDHFFPFAQKEGKWYRAARRADLYVMMKLDPKTPGTDEGWVYATVSPDGKTVTSAGRVASCMKCHEEKKDRLFGLPPGTRLSGMLDRKKPAAEIAR